MVDSNCSSVATTSTKPPPVIKTDIKRVLDRMQVQYRETKGGFECIHLPSIDISSVQAKQRPQSHRPQGSLGSNDAGVHPRQSIVKKASKLSFGVKREKGKDRDKERERENSTEKEKELPSRPSGGTVLTSTPSGSSSFFNVSANQPVTPDANGFRVEANEAVPSLTLDDQKPTESPSPLPNIKVLPPIPRDFAQPLSPMPTGEVDREVFESMGNHTLSVRFEINIVKVSPFL